MSANHPIDQSLTELLAHLDEEHGWDDLDRGTDRDPAAEHRLTEAECVESGQHGLLLRAGVYHEHRPDPDLGPCDVCGDPVTDRYGFRSGPAAYTVDICRDHAGLYGRRSY